MGQLPSDFDKKSKFKVTWKIFKQATPYNPGLLQINVALQTWLNLSEQTEWTDTFKQTCKQICPDKC